MTIEAKQDETNKLLGEILAAVKANAAPAAAPAGGGVASTLIAAAAAKAPAVVKTKPAAVKAPATPAPTPAPATPPETFDDFDSPGAEPEAPKLTVEDARKALVGLQKLKGSAEASRGVLKANGHASLATLKDSDQEGIAAIIAGCAEASKPKA